MPKIGLLSDSHGRAPTTRRAVAALLDRGAELLIHLGDVGTVEVIDALAVESSEGERIEAHLVFGNTDWDYEGLEAYAEDLEVQVDHPVGELETSRGALIFQHGDDVRAMQEALAAEPAYLCHGHTHQTLDEREGPTRIINPGALFRARVYTVAVLDPEADTLEFIEVAVP